MLYEIIYIFLLLAYGLAINLQPSKYERDQYFPTRFYLNKLVNTVIRRVTVIRVMALFNIRKMVSEVQAKLLPRSNKQKKFFSSYLMK